MNLRAVVNQFALLSLVLSVLMLGIGLWALVEWLLGDAAEKPAVIAMIVSAGVGAIIGGGLFARSRKAAQLGRREALLLVAASWLFGAALAGLPFLLWGHLQDVHADHPFMHPVNGYFEAMSGLTTTGATVLTKIADVPRSLLLWRAMTHWLGGLGIVVLFVAVLPSLGVGGKRLYKVEAPGPKAEGVTPHIRETARVLWLIYLGLTAVQTLALVLAGVPLFEAVCHTFATLATGGFSTHDASIAAYNSVAVDIITIVFMFLAGVNFALYFQLSRGRLSAFWKDTEFRVYLVSTLVAAGIVIAAIFGSTVYTTAGQAVDANMGQAVRYGLFSTVSIHTTTGFGTADFDRWPFIAQAVLITVMFIGGSAGSTGGGVKVIRLWIMLKVLRVEFEKAFRPQVVRPLRVGSTTIEPEQRTGAVTYVLSMILLAMTGSVLIMLCEQAFSESPTDYVTAVTASIATLFNIGPGLSAVGPTQTYQFFSPESKLVMSVLMALGRLELFAIIVLFTPRFWRPN
jgi:trk system potassium uptake protein TrkH